MSNDKDLPDFEEQPEEGSAYLAVPTNAPVPAEGGEEEELDLRDEAAIYLEQNHIGGDTMVMMNFCLDELPEEQIGSFNLFDLLSEFANKAIRNERPLPANSREEDAVKQFAEWLDKERNKGLEHGKAIVWNDMNIWGSKEAFMKCYQLYLSSKL